MTVYQYDPVKWFNRIASHLKASPNERGEVFIACPECGTGRKKFSFSKRGASCFLCGYRPSLKALAIQLGATEDRPYTPPPVQTRSKSYRARAWQDKAEQIAVDMAATPGAFQAWTAYKPINADTYKRNQLGFGTFPGGLWDGPREAWCHHSRLIVPLYENRANGRRIVGYRCRTTTCTCTKWLSPGGSRLVLYNAQRLKPGLDVVVVCENPIDALLVGQDWEGLAIATLGVSIWNDSYTEILKAANPVQVVIWFDHDIPGNCIDPDIIAAWKARRRTRNLPDDETKFQSGIRLTNRLLQAGLNASFYRWPKGTPEGADLGGFFK